MIFRGSGSILLGTLYFCDFSGGIPTPCPHSGSAHGMHLKEGTCLKCSFQRVVIIGRKVGLDYNSWYACWHFGRSSRSKRNVKVSQSILLQLLPMRTQNPNLSCASAFVRQSRTFHSIACNALRTFYRMHTFLN